MGCKGPETYANCPIQLYGDVGSNAWPVGTGHPCFGCSEQGVGFHKPLHEQASVFTVTPPAAFPDINQNKGGGLTAGAALVVGAAAGAAAVSGIKMSKVLKESDEGSEETPADKE